MAPITYPDGQAQRLVDDAYNYSYATANSATPNGTDQTVTKDQPRANEAAAPVPTQTNTPPPPRPVSMKSLLRLADTDHLVKTGLLGHYANIDGDSVGTYRLASTGQEVKLTQPMPSTSMKV